MVITGDSKVRILWKGEIFPAVSLIIAIDLSNPRSVIYELRCDIVNGVPTQVLSGELMQLTAMTPSEAEKQIASAFPAVRNMYYCWVYDVYKEELKHGYKN